MEETIPTSLHVRRPPHLSCIVRSAQSRQPATSASLPTNRHARLRLCAVLSLSSRSWAQGNCDAEHPPRYAPSAATPFFLSLAFATCGMQFLPLLPNEWGVAVAWCDYFSLYACGSRSLHDLGSVNTVSSEDASAKPRQLAHASKCSPVDR